MATSSAQANNAQSIAESLMMNVRQNQQRITELQQQRLNASQLSRSALGPTNGSRLEGASATPAASMPALPTPKRVPSQEMARGRQTPDVPLDSSLASASAGHSTELERYMRRCREYQLRVERDHLLQWQEEQRFVIFEDEASERCALHRQLWVSPAAALEYATLKAACATLDERLKDFECSSPTLRVLSIMEQELVQYTEGPPAGDGDLKGVEALLERIHAERTARSAVAEVSDAGPIALSEELALDVVLAYQQLCARRHNELAQKNLALASENESLRARVAAAVDAAEKALNNESAFEKQRRAFEEAENRHAERMESLSNMRSVLAQREEEVSKLLRSIADLEKQLQASRNEVYLLSESREGREAELIETCKRGEAESIAALKAENDSLRARLSQQLEKERSKRRSYQQQCKRMCGVYEECLAARAMLQSELMELQDIRAQAEAKANNQVLVHRKLHEKEIVQYERRIKQLQSLVSEKERIIDYLHGEVGIAIRPTWRGASGRQSSPQASGRFHKEQSEPATGCHGV